MGKNKVKSDSRMRLTKAEKAVAAVLIVLSFAAGGVFACFSAPRYFEEQQATVEIATEKDLLALTDGRMLNDIYELKADIDLSAPLAKSIGSEQFPFEGSFHGNGHTIRFAEGATGALPLFGAVAEGGEITCLALEGPHCDLSADGASASALVGHNAGTVENCLVRDYRVTLTGRYAYIGGIALRNEGTIRSCIAEISVTKNAPEDLRSVVGGAAAWNEGTLKAVIVSATLSGFTETQLSENMLGTASTLGIGSVSGKTLSEGSVTDCVSVRPTDEYGQHLVLSDSFSGGILFGNSREDVFNDDVLFRKNDPYLSKDVWERSPDGKYVLQSRA